MTDEREPAPWARSDLFATSRSQPSPQLTPGSKRKNPRKRTGTVLRVVGTVVLFSGALVLFGMAGAVSSEHQDDLRERGAGISVAQTRIDVAQKAESQIPDKAIAERALIRASEDAKLVAASQNSHLQNMGPLSLDGIATEKKLPTGGTQVYTEDERVAMAQKARDTAVSGLDRSLAQFFFPSALDDTGISAASNWATHVHGLVEQGDVTAYAWAATPVTTFGADLSTDTVWTLSAPDGRLVGWATASYNFLESRFTGLIITTAEGV